MTKILPYKMMRDNKSMLNIACGSKMHHEWTNVDFSPYVRLRKHMLFAKVFYKTGLLSPLRWKRLCSVDPETVCWDLRKGLPWKANTFDVVYHSHFLEHIPKEAAVPFLTECNRVLKPNGVVRVVVPDLHHAIELYNESWGKLETNETGGYGMHKKSIEALYDQMVRTTATGLSEQMNTFTIFLEKILRSSPAKTGELHRWMYDRYSLCQRLEHAGFSGIQVLTDKTSSIDDWLSYGLDQEEDGNPYKEGSLYMEGVKTVSI
jgi:SAM-dependent methyltransferase